MGNKLTLEDIMELLFKEYKENNRSLSPKQITDKNICSRSILKKYFSSDNKLTVDSIWQDVAKYYNCHINTELEQEKIDLIKKLKAVAKIEGEPVNSKNHRDLYCKGCRIFGSWRELCMSAGIKVSNIKVATLENDTIRKDELIEKILLIQKLNNNSILKKTTVKKYKNMPTVETIEKIFNLTWDEIIEILHLDMKNQFKYKYMTNKELLLYIEDCIKKFNCKSLVEYSFCKTEDKIEWIYVIDNLNITWEWYNALKRNKFITSIDKKYFDKFKCTKEELLNILQFKKIYFGKHLSSTEINNDIYLPNVTMIMDIFNKGIYEIWKDVDNNIKYQL
ncbi:hypothetical protein [Clostridium sp.]|uniref:hypothetical protein n=1 Tax=Clostridium sp. TaxID=1506 RepID=UPI00262E3A0B|nr:hypothetical protein [Clostridium sp.]